MAKKSVLVVGGHYSGKSKTINEHLKPLLKIHSRAHIFELNGQKGFVLSQSSEESKRDVEQLIKKYSGFDLFVLASRPESEESSNFKVAQKALEKASFKVSVVKIQSHDQLNEKALEIFSILESE